MFYKGVSIKELNTKQIKEYFEKVARKCINSWELYNAHIYVANLCTMETAIIVCDCVLSL